jgi:hypothetical protein
MNLVVGYRETRRRSVHGDHRANHVTRQTVGTTHHELTDRNGRLNAGTVLRPQELSPFFF